MPPKNGSSVRSVSVVGRLGAVPCTKPWARSRSSANPLCDCSMSSGGGSCGGAETVRERMRARSTGSSWMRAVTVHRELGVGRLRRCKRLCFSRNSAEEGSVSNDKCRSRSSDVAPDLPLRDDGKVVV